MLHVRAIVEILFICAGGCILSSHAAELNHTINSR